MHIPTREVIDHVTTYLRLHPDGVPFYLLAEKLKPLAGAGDVAAALATQVNAGHIRYGYRPCTEEDIRQEPFKCGKMVYYAAGDWGLVPVSRDDIDSVLAVLTRYVSESYEPEGRLQLAFVYEHFHGKMPRDGVGFALDVLRQEGLVEYNLYSHNGLAYLTVAPDQKFTVIARDIRNDQTRWLHVRAGSESAALKKALQHREGAALLLQGVAQGWVSVKPVGECSSIAVERM